MKTLILADNQAITKEGIRSISAGMGVFHICEHETTDIHTLIEELLHHPDAVCIIDYTLFDCTAEQLLVAKKRFPEAYFILFSDNINETFVRSMVFSGECFSIIFKDAELKEITACLNDASEGKQYISERAKAYLQNKSEDRKDNVQPLTATEKEILRALALGKSTKDIASERFISIHTAITHRKNIFRKLNVNNLNEAVRYAIRAGIVDITEYYI